MSIHRKLLSTTATLALAAGAFVVSQAAASAEPAAATTATDQPSVIFLGDSVTAGFGYFGTKEDAKNISGSVNNKFANSWYFGDNSLSDCNPPDGPTPTNQCSNNNYNGAPWSAGPWQAGPDAPNVAYSYQIAASQNPAAAAPIENWAITGSTPEQWDAGGAFSFELNSIKDTTVVLTLGANPILSETLNIKVSGFNQVQGSCSGMEWLGWTGWWAYPTSHVVDCVNQQWLQRGQTDHLLGVYKTLLKNNNHVLALRYPRGCPWSFGNWQPNGNIAKGPAAGNSCTSQKQKVSECSKCDVKGKVSQWDHFIGAHSALSDNIAAAVASAQKWAKNQGIDPTRIQLATPNNAEWDEHQAWSKDSWVFKNDTWIHPSKSGHTQLAKTVTQQTCASWGQWCQTNLQANNNGPGEVSWLDTPAAPEATKKQKIKMKRSKLGNKVIYDLPNTTKQGRAAHWRSKTPEFCEVRYGDEVRGGKKDGTCKLKASSVGGGSYKKLSEKFTIQVR
jgi:hypothetical protein